MYGFWFWLHVACAWLSAAGFVLRGMWMITDAPLRQAKPVRILPHLVDTLLLVSAVALAVMSGQYPFAEAWLTAKLLALSAYIGLGLVAFRFGPNKGVRTLAFVAAVAVVGYLLAVAYTRSALPLG